MSPNPITGDVVTEMRGRREMQTHKDHVKMKTEFKVMQPQGEKSMEPPEAGAFGGSAALPTP